VRSARAISTTAVTIVAIATADGYHTCAKLDDASLKCWGWNGIGQLGLGDTLDRGDEPGEMGDALPPVDLDGSVGFAPVPDGGDGGDDPEAFVDEDVIAPEDEADPFDDDRSDDGVDPEDDGAPGEGGCSTSRGGSSLALGVVLGLALIRRRRRR
jgi:MYXO-CTERM domain-containing protein